MKKRFVLLQGKPFTASRVGDEMVTLFRLGVERVTPECHLKQRLNVVDGRHFGIDVREGSPLEVGADDLIHVFALLQTGKVQFEHLRAVVDVEVTVVGLNHDAASPGVERRSSIADCLFGKRARMLRT